MYRIFYWQQRFYRQGLSMASTTQKISHAEKIEKSALGTLEHSAGNRSDLQIEPSRKFLRNTPIPCHVVNGWEIKLGSRGHHLVQPLILIKLLSIPFRSTFIAYTPIQWTKHLYYFRGYVIICRNFVQTLIPKTFNI